jgi:UTP-glucose-1-phosphate uridylyltransferase
MRVLEVPMMLQEHHRTNPGQAVILCGGLGTRLGDLTRNTPKPLLPVGGIPFLQILMQEITRAGSARSTFFRSDRSVRTRRW